MTILKKDCRPCGVPKQVVYARFEPLVALQKYQNALKMGHFGTKNGSKTVGFDEGSRGALGWLE